MCLIVFAYRVHPHYPVVIAANRDEFYGRPALPLAAWREDPDVVAGRDLEGGGTWMGLSRRGRMAALTNFREPGRMKAEAPTRGHLVSGFLQDSRSVEDYIRDLRVRDGNYNGYNLIISTGSRWIYTSNRGATARPLPPGIHGLSNHLLDTPWPKVVRSCRAMEDVLDNHRPPDMDQLMALLADRRIPPDAELPDTGIGLEWERLLGAVFIHSPTYGTRASTVLVVSRDGTARIRERSFDANGLCGEVDMQLTLSRGPAR